MLKKIRRISLAALLSGALALHGWAADFDPARYLEHVKVLASPELKGRGTGMPELDKAARYIEKQFRAIGLQPVAGSYFQPFPVTTNARMGPGNRLEYTLEGRKKALKVQQDFIPFNFSESGRLTGNLVFAGYGITAPEYGYDDYAGIDVKDKIVIVLRHEPQEHDENSVFAGKLLTEHAQFWSKAVNAKRQGARGVILVNDRASHGGADELEKFGRAAGPSNAGIPFLQVRASVVEEWLAAAGKNLDEIHADIDKDLKPQSFALPQSVRLNAVIDVRREVATVQNVAAYLPGETDEYIVIGAHYDHLGLGEQFSMAPSQAGTPHLGADDNASGVAGMIELARWFAARPKQKRGVLFLAFAAEELGLLGSRYWVDNPGLPIEKAVAMLNLDMIGRLREQKVYVGGADTGSTLKALLDEAFEKYQLRADVTGSSGVGSSDHVSFLTKQVPVLFFFSGLHGDYHKPSDTWDKIDAPAATELLRAVAEMATRLRSDPERPEFVKVAPAHAHGQAAGGGGGYGAWFGSIPDFGEIPTGVKFADVQAGSPAEKAGLRAGDILVEFDGKPIENLYDFTYALRARKPGDEVAVKVLRGGETVEAKVVLAQRK